MKNSNVCGCCLTEGCSKNLDDEENYRIMSETFNLTLNNNQRFFCQNCIRRVRDAASFKQQILEVDETLNKLNAEHTNLFNKSNYDDDEFSCDAWDGLKRNDELFDIKSEPMEDKICTSDNENKSQDTGIKMRKKISCKSVEKLKGSAKPLKKNTNPEKEAEKEQLENSMKLITNSNLCLFKSLRTKLACYVCNEKFFEMKELRIHSKIHSKEDFSRHFKRLRGKSYENADITNLTCNTCFESCSDLDTLKNHLYTHDIIITNANHILIPYKLDEGLNCLYCNEHFNTFTRLSIHMNVHATSNVCETCGMAFYNRISLRNHIRSLHKEHKCTQCTSKFPTSTKLVRHKRKVHNTGIVKHYCSRCTLTFRYSYLLKNHMVEKHGGKITSVHCSSCKKVFKDSNNLKIHFRSVHLNERDFSCSVCELSFFTRSGRMRHERVHQSGTVFGCNLCETKFKSKDSVRRHLKRQHGFRNEK